MSILTHIENFVSALIEGIFGIGSERQPEHLIVLAERAITSATTNTNNVSDMPNVFTFQVPKKWFNKLNGLAHVLEDEIRVHIQDFYQQRNYQTKGPYKVNIQPNEKTKSFQISCSNRQS